MAFPIGTTKTIDLTDFSFEITGSPPRAVAGSDSGASQDSTTDGEHDGEVDDLAASVASAIDRSTQEADRCPKAKIVLTHNTPHTLDCSPACLKHMHFLIRVLPTGRVTPVAELSMPALANIARRHEEQFCIKTFADFEVLHAALRQTKGTTVSLRPDLPRGTLQRKSFSGRMTTGVKHNPDLVEQLQTYLDTILCQLPAHGTKSDPALASFFASDRVELTHPLVQASMPSWCDSPIELQT